MTNTIATGPPPEHETDGMGREELRGRAAGVTVGAVMGLAWAGSALGTLPAAIAVPVLIAGLGIVAVLMTGARRLRRAAAGMPASAPLGTGRQRFHRRFNLVVAGEFAAIIAAVIILGRTGRSEWIPAATCAVVGLHFIPLARLFHLRLYNTTAAALCLVAATTMVLGAAGAPAPVWVLVPGFGAALALWGMSASMLVTTMPAAVPSRR